MTGEQPSLLIVSGTQGDPRRYRTFHLYEQASLAGIKCQLSHVTDPQIKRKVSAAKIVILHRAPFDSLIAWIVRTVRHNSGNIILDLDDLLIDPEAMRYIDSPDFADPIRRSLYQEDIHRYRETLECCDYVITPVEFLAQQVRLLGKPAVVHRNAFSLEMLSISNQANTSRKAETDKIVIGYASGTPTHDQDFALAKSTLQLILRRYPNVELRLVGPLHTGEDWADLEKQVGRIKRVSWRHLPAILAQFDINLAPLRIDNPFGQSKSEIKYMEASLVRVPTIASRGDAFTHAIQQGDTGLLATGPEEWEGAIELLIDQAISRRTIGERAYQDVLQRYHPVTRAHELVDLLNIVTGAKLNLQYNGYMEDIVAQESMQTFWSSAKIEKSPNLLQRGFYTIRYRNISCLLKQMWIFIRRKISPIFPFQTSPNREDHDALSS